MNRQPEPPRWTLEIYASAAGEHRWRLVSPTGRTIAESGEGYGTSRAAEKAAERLAGRLTGRVQIKPKP